MLLVLMHIELLPSLMSSKGSDGAQIYGMSSYKSYSYTFTVAGLLLGAVHNYPHFHKGRKNTLFTNPLPQPLKAYIH